MTTVIIDQDDDVTITVKTRCPMCGTTTNVEVSAVKFRRWQDGALIQRVWPDAAPYERELLQTGIDNACWQKMWADE